MTNDHFLFEKPILIYWSIIASFKCFGITEFAARLPSVLAGSLTAVVAYIFGRFFKIGLILSLILITSSEFFIISRLSTPDALLNLFIVSTLLLFFLLSENLIHKNYWYLAAVTMSLGFLTKGPLAIFVPSLVIFCYMLYKYISGKETITKTFETIKNHILLITKSAVIFIILGLGWYLVAHIITDGGFTHQFFITENLNRYKTVLTGHQFPWWFYFPVGIIGFLPWSFFLPNYLIKIKTNILANKELINLKVFSLIWIISNLVFFTSSSTKLYNYILSIFFPLSVLLALWFYEKFETSRKSISVNCILLSITSAYLLYKYLQGSFDHFIASKYFLLHHLNHTSIITTLLVLLLIGVSGRLIVLFKIKSKVFFYLLCFFSMLLYLAVVRPVTANYASYRVANIKNFVESIPASTKLYKIRMDRPSVTYYFKQATEVIGIKILRNKLNEGKEKLCIIAQKSRLEKIQSLKQLKISKIDNLYLYACN